MQTTTHTDASLPISSQCPGPVRYDVGVLPGAGTMGSSAMIEACRACYAVSGFLCQGVGGRVRRAWERGSAWEVAVWCVRLQVAAERAGQGRHRLVLALDRALTDLCCSEGLDVADLWRRA